MEGQALQVPSGGVVSNRAAGKDESLMVKEFTTLEQAMDYLMKEVETLESRLGPILVERPEKDPVSLPDGEGQPSSDLVIAIKGIVSRIDGQARRVAGITSKLSI